MVRPWHLGYRRALLASDLLALLIGFGVAQQLHGRPSAAPFSVLAPQLELVVLLALAWWASLHLHDTRSARIVGHGVEEYRRVVLASFRVLAMAALLVLASGVEVARGHLAVALPLGMTCLLLGRRTARVWLHSQRRRGQALRRVLVVGGRRSASRVVDSWRCTPAAGYDVAGFWTSEGLERPEPEAGRDARDPAPRTLIPLREALTATGADAVLVTDAAHLGAGAMRELTWELDGSDVELFFSPDVLDVAKTRLQLQDVSGRPMLHVDAPRYRGANRFAKTVFDRVGAVVALALFLPVLVATAVAVKLSSRGPVLYRQVRVGRNGRPFEMLKFRSMRVDADSQLLTLLAQQGRVAGELPKLEDDPRICGVGRFIRRFSIDELPQLLNVLKGDMSLVGPRPQRHFEVALYDHVAHRRLALRPGMTGLWQVSGRSNLSFTEAIRLDVHYVENWSLFNDLVILWKTARAVLSSDGAC